MNIQIQKRSLFLIVSILLLLTRVQSIQFDLLSGHTKCIAEDIRSNSMTVGKYQIVNNNAGHPLPYTHKITVRVTSVYGNSYHYSENVTEGHFAFQTVEEGDYMTCFFAADHKPTSVITIEFDWKSGFATKDWTSVAKKDSVKSMESELEEMVNTVESIHKEMIYLRQREAQMHQLNIATNSKMAWLSLLSLIVSLSVAGLQLWHLKAFFQKKKVI